jgi:hypothetical protein
MINGPAIPALLLLALLYWRFLVWFGQFINRQK